MASKKRDSGSQGVTGVPENLLTAAFRFLTQKSAAQAPSLSFVVLEPTGDMSHERLGELVSSSLPQLTRFRSKLVERPWGVGPPVWTEIDNFDPSSHIHRATLQPPGDPHAFAELIAQLSSGSRTHREMLWEAWSIDGLAGGRWALVVRLSPTLSNGDVNAPSIWSRLLHSEAYGGGDNAEQLSPDTPAMVEVVAQVVGELLQWQFKALFLLTQTVTGIMRTAGGLPSARENDPVLPAEPSMRGPLPRNAFNAPLTERRAVAFGSIRQGDLEAVSTAFGGDDTNVLLAACTMSLRGWLQRHGAVPDHPMAMWMPLALPTGDGDAPTAGQIRIPVQLGDPIEILTQLHTATERLNTAHTREDEREQFVVGTAAISSLIPSTVLHAGARIFRQLNSRRTSTSHASVATDTGHSSSAYCAGAEVVARHTVMPLPEGCGLTITPTTQGDEIHLSVCVCPDNVVAVDEIAAGITEALETLVDVARKSPRGQGRSVVTEMAAHSRNRRH